MTTFALPVEVVDHPKGLVIQSREPLSQQAMARIRDMLSDYDGTKSLALDFPLYVVDPDVAERLDRIEARLDALEAIQ